MMVPHPMARHPTALANPIDLHLGESDNDCSATVLEPYYSGARAREQPTRTALKRTGLGMPPTAPTGSPIGYEIFVSLGVTCRPTNASPYENTDAVVIITILHNTHHCTPNASRLRRWRLATYGQRQTTYAQRFRTDVQLLSTYVRLLTTYA